MKWTNKFNLPSPLANAIMHDPYSKGISDFSVTELISPPRIRILRLEHEDEIVEDVSDHLWRFFGSAIHASLERHDTDGKAAPERRLSITLSDGTTVSGGMDRFIFESGTLQDYKTTSIWAVKNAGTKTEWEEQLNCYAEILRFNKIDVKNLEIIAIGRDHRVSEEAKDEKYPKPCTTIPIEMWEPRMAMAFIEERVRVHREAIGELPLCTNDERWAQPEIWAVKKIGTSRAINGGLYPSKHLAVAFVMDNPGHWVEHRKPTYNRCAKYCAVAKFCTQYQETIHAT